MARLFSTRLADIALLGLSAMALFIFASGPAGRKLPPKETAAQPHLQTPAEKPHEPIRAAQIDPKIEPVPAPATQAHVTSTRRLESNGYNILFIIVDDLRPTLHCYGDAIAKSPNIDALAARGTQFNRAYCQQALCAPSRTSVLTGLRPDTTHCYDLKTFFRDNVPSVVTLPQQFKSHGYHTEAMGKVYHTNLDDKLSWSVPLWTGVRDEPEDAANAILDLPADGRPHIPPWELSDIPDDHTEDGKIATHAMQRLAALKNERFFLAVGFHKPHLPFYCPKRYWDLYAANDVKLADNPFMPKGAPDFAGTKWGELRAYDGIPHSGPLSDEQSRMMVHGYYACSSFADAQVGRVLDELDRLDMRKNTIVIVWGDHGWHLGDHGLWCKQTDFETADHAPMILSIPGQQHPGAKCDGLVELIDIYPTLCELCSVPIPPAVEATSFVPLIDDPTRAWKKAALTQTPRNIHHEGEGMGYAIVNERYRYVEWVVPGRSFKRAELYDHQNDPEENTNLADEKKYAPVAAEMSQMLHRGWRGLTPVK